jgi:hypothetical protein
MRSYKMASQNVATVILPNARDDPLQTRSHAEITIRDTCSPPLVYVKCEPLSGKGYAAEGASSVYN